MNRLRVAVAELPTIRSEAIRIWLSAYPDLAVAQAASSVEEAVSVAFSDTPMVCGGLMVSVGGLLLGSGTPPPMFST